VRLRRVRIGPISDTRLKTGHWRELSEREIEALKRAAGLREAAEATGPKKKH
jgi:16S rRNA U516 pseudouridylate synthase RsuA-like enzyme